MVRRLQPDAGVSCKARSLGVVYREGEIAAVERDGARVVRRAVGERRADRLRRLRLCGRPPPATPSSPRRIGIETPVSSRKRCVFTFQGARPASNAARSSSI